MCPDRGVLVLPVPVLLGVSPQDGVQGLPLLTPDLLWVLVCVGLQAAPPGGVALWVATSLLTLQGNIWADLISSHLPEESLVPGIRK